MIAIALRVHEYLLGRMSVRGKACEADAPPAQEACIDNGRVEGNTIVTHDRPTVGATRKMC